MGLQKKASGCRKNRFGKKKGMKRRKMIRSVRTEEHKELDDDTVNSPPTAFNHWATTSSFAPTHQPLTINHEDSTPLSPRPRWRPRQPHGEGER